MTRSRALASLLGGPEGPELVLLVQTLCAGREGCEEEVRWVARYGKEPARSRARRVLLFWKSEGEAGPTEGEVLDVTTWEALEGFCWTISERLDPGFRREEGVQALDEWARWVGESLEAPDGRPLDGLRALRDALAGGAGLRGNARDYYHPDNSLLSRLVATREGLPLTLSLAYIFVGARVGLEVEGLNTPGHYLAVLENRVFDPFFGGVELGAGELAERFGLTSEAWIHPVTFRATPLGTAVRMLGNLSNSLKRAGRVEDRARVEGWLKLLQGLPA
ncbi:MAG: transglutaminase family protein [Verrucomicrobiia bacterium]